MDSGSFDYSGIEVEYEICKQISIEDDGVIYLGRTSSQKAEWLRLKKLFLHVDFAPEELLELSAIVRSLKKLRERGIPVVQDLLISKDKKDFYTVSRHVDGTELSMLFVRKCEVELPRLLKMVENILRSLSLSSDIGSEGDSVLLTHGDICPEKIALQEDGSGCLLDFGMRELIDVFFQADPEIVSQEGLCNYWEQADGRPERASRDRYALGMILLEGLTGTPLSLRNAYTMLNRYGIEPELGELEELCQDLPTQVKELILRVLHSDKAERFQTHNEFLQALRGCMESYPVINTPHEKPFDEDLVGARTFKLKLARFIPCIEKGPIHKAFWDLLHLDTLDDLVLNAPGPSRRQEQSTHEFIALQSPSQSPFSREEITTRELPAIKIVAPETLGL